MPEVGGGDVAFFTPLTADQRVSPLWRQVVTNLEGETLTVLDKLASNRRVTPLLDAPLIGTFDVPSDNPEVNIRTPGPEDLPFVNEGVRLCYWFRREKATPQYYYPRASTIILQTEDTALQDDSVTHVTCYDPWQYLYYVAIKNADGDLPKTSIGVSFSDSTAGYIAAQLVSFAFEGADPSAPEAAKHSFIDIGYNPAVGDGHEELFPGGTEFWGGTYDPLLDSIIDIAFPRGWTIGQAWDKLVSEGYCDIVLTPVYDPVNRPGILCDLSVFLKAGTTRNEAIFAWDEPGRNLTQISRLVDGTVRANTVQVYAGIGGSSPDGNLVAVETDPTSIAQYGEYWALQNASGLSALAAASLAADMLFYRHNFRQIVNWTPAPERAPLPFRDFVLGDYIRSYASERFRESIPPGNIDPEANVFYQRIFGFPLNISDDGLETVEGMLLAPSELQN